MRLLVIVLAACGSRTSIEAPEPPRTAGALAQRIATIERPAQRPTEITGSVLDASGNHVKGVLVELLVGGEAFENTTSDGNGRYVLAVPPAAYRLRFRYDEWEVEHDIVAVAGERTWANTMVVERSGITFSGATVVDMNYVVEDPGVTIAQDYVRNHPIQVTSFGCGSRTQTNTFYVEGISTDGLVFGDTDTIRTIPVPGRTFEEALGAASGSQGDDLGVSFSSGTTLENEYIVDPDAETATNENL